MKTTILLVLLLVFTLMKMNAQIIWSENFNSYGSCVTTGANLNTGNPANDWTTIFQDCDDGATTCTLNQSFFGTSSGQFRVNDIEGGPCTGGSSCAPGGTTQNFITTESISISGATGVAISIVISQTGSFESGALGGCDNSEDIVHVTYSIDGGPFTQFATNGFLTGNFGTVTTSQSCLYGGNTLVIRIQAGNKANDEHIFIDNIVVTETGCPPLPVELVSFDLQCSNNDIIANWITASEINNSHFILQGSKDAIEYVDLHWIEGHGNSNIQQTYSVQFSNFERYNYFRLIQVDHDGAYTYYDPKYANCGSVSNEMKASFSNGSFQIQLPSNVSGSSQLSILDLNGKVIFTNTLDSQHVNGSISIQIGSMPASGLYLISLRDGLNMQTFTTRIFILE